ncbi:MAG: hypothetical protein MUO52_01010 [Desulfobacterales bacterium]|nr:hypothetical protein [Desulfobacterales bacterium]
MDVLRQYTKNPQQVLLFLESLRKSLIRIGLAVVSLTLIAVPLYILFELGIFGMQFWGK